jgi:hypothetical protein
MRAKERMKERGGERESLESERYQEREREKETDRQRQRQRQRRKGKTCLGKMDSKMIGRLLRI